MINWECFLCYRSLFGYETLFPFSLLALKIYDSAIEANAKKNVYNADVERMNDKTVEKERH